MSHDAAERHAAGVLAVMKVARAARALAEPGAERERLAARLVESTGLSHEGVIRALERHLETEPPVRDVGALVAGVTPSARVLVVLSANVFVGALRAVALARAASAAVVVRPSRRDPIFARALVEALADDAVRLDEAARIEAVEDGEVHVYGHDATIADVRARVRVGVRVRGHGSGLGVAWVARGDDVELAARALADDVVAFDQRGCLSPRAVLVEGDLARANRFAEALEGALTVLQAEVPRGVVPDDVRAEHHRWTASVAYAGRLLPGAAHAVGVLPTLEASALPPTHRHVLVVPVAGIAEGAAAVAPFARAVVAVGSDAAETAPRLGVPWARTSRLGAMQSPPLDGPVDRRDDGA